MVGGRTLDTNFPTAVELCERGDLVKAFERMRLLGEEIAAVAFAAARIRKRSC
jgi:hypothetical protein